MSTTGFIDPVTGAPIVISDNIFQQIPLGQSIVPFADLDATDRPKRLPLYPDDVIPTLSSVVGQRQKVPRAISASLVANPEGGTDKVPALNVNVAAQTGGSGGLSPTLMQYMDLDCSGSGAGEIVTGEGGDFSNAILYGIQYSVQIEMIPGPPWFNGQWEVLFRQNGVRDESVAQSVIGPQYATPDGTVWCMIHEFVSFLPGFELGTLWGLNTQVKFYCSIPNNGFRATGTVITSGVAGWHY